MTAKEKKRLDAYFQKMHKDMHENKVKKETSLKPHFMTLLRDFWEGDKKGSLIEEFREKTQANRNIYYDARLSNEDGLTLGHIEAKDDRDELEKEINAKKESGYQFQNILFWQPKGIILIQEEKKVSYNGQEFIDLSESNKKREEDLLGIIKIFLNYMPPALANFKKNQEGFLSAIQEQADWLKQAIKDAYEQENLSFQQASQKLEELFEEALDRRLSQSEMIDWAIQHFFMRSIFLSVFKTDFLDTNPIAKPLESFLKELAYTKRKRNIDDLWQVNEAKNFYQDLSASAGFIKEEEEKQRFLNIMYERFFSSYATKEADKFGVVYTPPEVVRFMLLSVDSLLKKEFHLKEGLSTHDVKIIDPFVGTGNFLVHLLPMISYKNLEYKYKNDLFANEIQLMPYYISQVNLGDAYWACGGKGNLTFPNLALADTFDLLETIQIGMPFQELEENQEIIKRQQKASIQVIIGNPPYNAGQAKEDDNNKNKKHPYLDSLVKEDYANKSKVTNKNALYDVYVKAFRWATDRLKNEKEGIVAFISNGSFLEAQSFDGMRGSLLESFDKIYLVNLKGNVRKNPKISGTKNNIFGIQVDVAISFLVKNPNLPPEEKGIYYQEVEKDEWTRYEKLAWLSERIENNQVNWSFYQKLEPQKEGRLWITTGMAEDFNSLIPLGTKEGKKKGASQDNLIFKTYSSGVGTARDIWAYNFSYKELEKNMQGSINFFNNELSRYQRDWQEFRATNVSKEINDKELAKKREEVLLDTFLANNHDMTQIKWSESLKKDFIRLSKNLKSKEVFNKENIRLSQYRPFLKKNLYFDRLWNERVYLNPLLFPHPEAEKENKSIITSGIGFRNTFGYSISNKITDLAFYIDSTQCFPLYTYTALEENNKPQEGEILRHWGGITYRREENISDWALAYFQKAYKVDSIKKEDIFYYIYALLNHPDYTPRYEANLKGDLARIGIVGSSETFFELVGLGESLANAMLNYEEISGYELEKIQVKELPSHEERSKEWEITSMKLIEDSSHSDKLIIALNDYIHYKGIPKTCLDFKIEGRSPLEWFIKNFKIKSDKESAILDNPNDLWLIGEEEPNPYYAEDLIPRLVQVGLIGRNIQESLKEIPLIFKDI